jgi:acyl carrier protein
MTAAGGSTPKPPPPPRTVESRVKGILAQALDRQAGDIHLHSSLVDDLGAESIDFMDIAFRLEDEFGIEIPDEELWRGGFGPGEMTPERLAAGVTALRERLPAFRWDRFPDGVRQQDLPRLVSVSTIVNYLETRLPGTPGTPEAPVTPGMPGTPGTP